MSAWLMKFLLGQYIILVIVCCFEHNWVRGLYWLGASILTVSVLVGMK